MELARTSTGAQAQVARPSGAVQTVTISGNSAATTAFSGNYTTVRVVSTTDCHFRIGGVSDSATTSYSFLPANTIEYMFVNAGDYIHFIQNSSGGTAYITVCS